MSYKIVSKFIKDISFEIPNPKTFILLDKEIKNYKLTFDIKSKPYKDNIVEVNTILKLVPGNEVKDKMLTEINLTALITIDTNIKDKKDKVKVKDNNKVDKVKKEKETPEKKGKLKEKVIANSNAKSNSNSSNYY